MKDLILCFIVVVIIILGLLPSEKPQANNFSELFRQAEMWARYNNDQFDTFLRIVERL